MHEAHINNIHVKTSSLISLIGYEDSSWIWSDSSTEILFTPLKQSLTITMYSLRFRPELRLDSLLIGSIMIHTCNAHCNCSQASHSIITNIRKQITTRVFVKILHCLISKVCLECQYNQNCLNSNPWPILSVLDMLFRGPQHCWSEWHSAAC